MTKTFHDLGVDEELADALAAEGITHPFPIQELTLPLALAGNDLIGQARTGTGKTLAFGLPLLQRLDPSKAVTQALVVVPTRELCLQVYADLRIGARKGITSVSVYGGVGYEDQTGALRTGAHVVVGTPGRLLDHLDRGNLDLSQVSQLVLDEADEMLDMGFLPDVERLIQACSTERHTMLFSATMPTAIVKLARRYLDHPTFTRADTELHETAPTVEQHFLQVHRMDKPRVLARILQSPGRAGVYVFVRTKHMADRLVHDLEELGIAAIPIHGDLRQEARERNLDRFRSGKATVLVATEVAARGLDVTGVTHVVNYDCPDDEKMYLHRIGRTARAGEAGVAVTFAEFNEVDRLNVIRRAVGATDTPLEQVFSTSESLTRRFDLPEETPWGSRARRAGDRVGVERDTGRGREVGDGARRGRGADRGDEGAARRAADAARPSARRRGRTDGRPKSARRAEGTGGGHDAAPPQRESSGTPRRARTRTRERTQEASDAATDGRTATSPAPESAGRDRTPKQAGRDRIPKQAGPDRTPEPARRDRTAKQAPPEQAGAKPSRSRSRRRSGEHRDPAERPLDGTTRGGDAAHPDAPEARDIRDDGSSARRSGGRSRARAAPADESATTDGSRRRAGSAGGDDGQGRHIDRRGAAAAARSASRAGAKGSGGRGRRGGDGVSAEPIKLAVRGRDARGDGQPQLSRRVKVEHLP